MRSSSIAALGMVLLAFGCSAKKSAEPLPVTTSQTMMLPMATFDAAGFAANPFDDGTYVPSILLDSLDEIRATHGKEMAQSQLKVPDANAEAGYVVGTAFATTTFIATYLQISLGDGKKGFLRHSLGILQGKAKLKNDIRLGMRMGDLLKKVWQEYPGANYKVLQGRYYMNPQEDVWIYFDTMGEVLDALEVVVGD